MKYSQELLTRFNAATGEIAGVTPVERHLSDLRGCFYDPGAYQSALSSADPVVYSVATVEPGTGEGDLHYGIGRLLPGRVGDEYYMTKGHLHTWREAAEVYIGLAGDGVLLLEEEASGESRIVPLRAEQAVYVPAHTAHRTINIGKEPLLYLGLYPARAGHDYAPIARRNFRKVLLERNGRPFLLDRDQAVKTPSGKKPEGNQ